MKITLSLPHKHLSPNARAHHMAKASAKKMARQDAAYTTMISSVAGISEARKHFAGDFPIPVRILFYPATRRNRDVDNVQASLKAALDGIADALHVDDSRFRPITEIMPPDPPGRVEVLL